MRSVTPLSAAKDQAAAIQTELANSKLRLFKEGFVPAVNTTQADLIAQECDFTDYTAKTITTWGAPVLSPVSGYQIVAPLQTFTVATATVGNTVGGYWVETAGGVVMSIVQFDTGGVPMSAVDQSVQVVPTITFPTQNLSA